MKNMILSIIVCCFTIIAAAQPSSFSLRNSHVTMPQGYNDFSLKNSGVVGSSNFGTYIDLGGGNWFKGSTSNGRPSRGTLHMSNGIEHKGAFNANIQPTGVEDTRDRYTVTRLPAPKKGINIINGQKVVVK